ncbi:hypothetical protein [Bacillus marinisedimentorum]|uniref:hypothetical protein n=1 Tax=Bacillus marinisedimentorum TaxID=1821260 RepID=UPI00087303AD|nr:hypothetical protein [Bacillus marinisedimentorum]
MRYTISDIQLKKGKVRLICQDLMEEATLHVSLDPDTLECLDPFIPEDLQRCIGKNRNDIFLSLQAIALNEGRKERKVEWRNETSILHELPINPIYLPY